MAAVLAGEIYLRIKHTKRDRLLLIQTSDFNEKERDFFHENFPISTESETGVRFIFQVIKETKTLGM